MFLGGRQWSNVWESAIDIEKQCISNIWNFGKCIEWNDLIFITNNDWLNILIYNEEDSYT